MDISSEEFIEILEWRMCSDPFTLPENKMSKIDVILNNMAFYYGYNDWIDAYHKLGKVI